MKVRHSHRSALSQAILMGALVCFVGVVGPIAVAQDLVPLKLDLPKQVYIGTPKNIAPNPNLEMPTGKARPAVMVPKDTVLLSAGKSVKSSDEEPIIGDIEMITDGDKEAADGSYVELGPGLQWVQVDLGKVCEIVDILVWHYHQEARVYRDVVVQVADDPDFITNVKALFNNDYDNSSGLGVGQDKEYFDSHEGRLIDGKGAKARYIRLYSNGSTAGDQNHYIEVEVYGKPTP